MILPKSKSNTEIYFSNIDGSEQRNSTNHESADFNPIWDKNDNGFYFISYRSGSAQIYYLPLNRRRSKTNYRFLYGIEFS